EGAPSDTSPDSFAFESVAYRRRIESIDLQTIVALQAALRSGEPTESAVLGFYEDWEATRLRITGTALGYTQVIDGSREATIQPRGFIEYSWRVRSNFFILPRLGYDGFYSTLTGTPKSSRDVDDNVYNAFRQHRNTFGFLQGLFWFVPHFNDIFY